MLYVLVVESLLLVRSLVVRALRSWLRTALEWALRAGLASLCGFGHIL